MKELKCVVCEVILKGKLVKNDKSKKKGKGKVEDNVKEKEKENDKSREEVKLEWKVLGFSIEIKEVSDGKLLMLYI